MRTHYSLLFATLRKVTQEKVSLGLLLFDGENALCRFSHSKIGGLRHLLPKEDYKVISDAVTILERKMRQTWNKSPLYSNLLFKIEDPEFSLDYVNYLSRYKNNLVTYSEPKPIDIEVTETNALKLFEKLVDAGNAEEVITKKPTPIRRLTLEYEEKIRRHFIANHTVTYEDLPNLLVPVKVDLVGKNGIDVFVQSIDMTAGQNQIINEISTFYLLKDTYKKNKFPLMDFVLSEEPPIELKRQHEIWSQLVESKEFNYVDISEGERIIIYAEQNQVRPVFGDSDETDELRLW